MTSAHIATIHFGGKDEAASKRLRKLKAAGFLVERPRRVNERAVFFLTRKAFVVLREEGVLSQYPAFDLATLERRAQVSDRTVSHELEVMDVKAALCAAIQGIKELTVSEFSTWPLLNQFEISHPETRLPFMRKPDGFIRIGEQNENGENQFSFFLEVDRSSETIDTIANHAACYREYYRTGGFALRQGSMRDQYKAFPFRVLMILKNAERRNNVADMLVQLSPPILHLVWLTTFKEATADPLGEIWVRPGDYQKVVQGTRFEVGKLNRYKYKRESERETHVEKHIQKLDLLERNLKL
jgi:hypothetical protein